MKVITVGRSQECNVVVNDEKASRVHLQLVQDDNGNVSVIDLGSTNGTWVNDNRISGEMRLNQGDRIRVGNTLLQWQNYFAANSGDGELTTNINKNAASSYGNQPPKPNRTLMWIIIAVVAVLLAVGGTAWILHEQHVKNSEKEAAERNAKKSVEQSDIAVAEAEAKSDYNTKLRNAAEIEKADAEAAKGNAEVGKEKAEVAKAKAEAAKAKAEAAKATAEKEKATAEKEKAAAEKEKVALEAEKAAAEKEYNITKAFYTNLSEAERNNKLYEVCKELKMPNLSKTFIEQTGVDKDANRERYKWIVDKFKSASNNDERQNIVNKIEKIIK